MSGDLSVLERRLKDSIPEKYHKHIEKNIDRFEMETKFVSDADEKTGQSQLSQREINRLRTANQHSQDGLTVIEWQVVKGAAMKYGVHDWTTYADPELSVEENKEIMRQKGTIKPGKTTRELAQNLYN